MAGAAGQVAHALCVPPPARTDPTAVNPMVSAALGPFSAAAAGGEPKHYQLGAETGMWQEAHLLGQVAELPLRQPAAIVSLHVGECNIWERECMDLSRVRTPLACEP